MVRVSKSEVESYLKRLKSAQGKEQFEIFEIFLPIMGGKNGQATKSQIHNIHTQLTNGANFITLAQQFSHSFSSNGYRGWLVKDQLGPEEKKALENLKIGSFSSPIKTPAGWKIFMLRDKRSSGGEASGEAQYTYHQLSIPFDESMSEAELENLQSFIGSLEAVSGSKEFAHTAKEKGYLLQKQTAAKKDMPEELLNLFKSVNVNRCCAPVRTSNALLVFMLTGIQKPKPIKLPSVDEAREHLLQEKLAQRATGHLNKVRAMSYIKTV